MVLLWITGIWPSSNDTIFSPFCHNSAFSPFCHHFVTIYDETTENIQQRQAQSSDREYYNGTKNVIAVTESINVCLNSVDASFQMILYACEFAGTANSHASIIIWNDTSTLLKQTFIDSVTAMTFLVLRIVIFPDRSTELVVAL